MNFKNISFSLADHIAESLQTYCKKTGQKQTDVIRQAVYEFLNPYYTDNSIYNTTDTSYNITGAMNESTS